MPVTKSSTAPEILSGGVAAGPGPEGEQPKAKTGAKPKVEAVANEELVNLLVKYDENVAKAESMFIEFVEFIQANQLPRPVIVASMMKARGISFESADTQYSRMKKLLNNQEVLQDLKDGKITLKVAREKTKGTQANPKSAKPEAREAKYQKAMKDFVGAAKEGGYPLKSILVSIEAELKAAGVK